MSELVQLSEITKVYQGGVTGALNGVSLTVEEGEFTAVMGPSGSGKTTLLNLIAGLDRPTTGGVLVAGSDLGQLGETALARFRRDHIGFVFQFFHLLPNLTVLENVLIPAQLKSRVSAEARGRELLSQLGIAELAERYPAKLSGGQPQRVSIARALIHQPSILLMDEPFGALDAITRTQIRHDLELLWMETRKTVLFITHSIEEAIGLSDRVLVMSPNPGRIVDEIAIDLPRPRPAVLGEDASFNAYAERIHRAFLRMGVIKY